MQGQGMWPRGLPAPPLHLVQVCDVSVPVDDQARAEAIDVPLVLLHRLLPAGQARRCVCVCAQAVCVRVREGRPWWSVVVGTGHHWRPRVSFSRDVFSQRPKLPARPTCAACRPQTWPCCLSS